MKSSRALSSSRTRGLVAFLLATIIILAPVEGRADMTVGRLQRDMTVGANQDVPLKTGEVVQILNQAGAKTVIMVPLPDGSNGIFQIDSSAIQVAPPGTPLGLPPPPPPPPPAPGTVPPNYPSGFFGAATFQTTLGEHAGGMAAVVKLGSVDQAYLISARQLLGPLGGFDQQVAAKDVPNVVQHIQLAPPSGTATTYNVAGLPVHTSRLKADSGKPIDDMAIFLLHDNPAQVQPVALADQMPAVDDIVWLVARLSRSPADQLAHRAVVTANSSWLEVQFDDDHIVTSGAAGAPVLNNAGQVVGVFSSSLAAAGHVRGYIIPAPLIVKTIQSVPR